MRNSPLSATSAELGLGLGLGLGWLSGLGLNFLLASASFTHSHTLSLDSYCRPTTGKSSSPAGLSTLVYACLVPKGGTEAQEPAVCTARSRLQLALHARRDPFRDKIREVGRGLSLADTQTGRYGRLYSRRRLCAGRGADARLLLRILLELVQPLATLASPRS
jgi:hypothetical protein